MENIQLRNNVPLSVLISMLGGALIIVGGLGLFTMFSWRGSTLMMGGAWHMYQFIYPYWLSAFMIGLSILAGTVVVAASYKMYKEPENNVKWGLMVIIGSVVGLFGIGGFGLGGVLGLIGGLASMSRK